jgi:hypothetical protein
VFFSNVGYFMSYSYCTAKVLSTLLFAASVVLVHAIYVEPAPALRTGKGVWRKRWSGCCERGCGRGCWR